VDDVVVLSDCSYNVGETYAINVFRDEGTVDANGAGDAFVGGSIGALTTGESLGEATEVGHALGTIYAMQVSGRKRRFCGRT
jgi:adenosine kinase